MATVPGKSNVIPMMPEWAKPTQADFLQAAAIMNERSEREETRIRPDEEPEPPISAREQKEMIEAKRWFNDLNITPKKPELTPSEAETIPGRRIP